MEATQMISDSILESDEDENEEETNKRGQPLAKLRILKNQHIPETELPLFLGDNVLGRDPSSCTLNLPAGSVSKQHATICISVYRRRGGQSEVDMEALVWDHGSMNGTRKGHLKLTPNVRYALSEGDSLVVADIPCQYVSWSAHTASSQGDTRTPPSQNSGVKARLPDTSRENDGDTRTGGKKCVDRSTKPLVSLRSPDRGSCLSFEQTPIQPHGILVPESDSDSDGERGGKAGRSRSCLVSDSDSHKSSPNCSTFLSPANKTIPESEDESLITPSSSHKNRPHRHVSFTTEETDEDVGRQELHKANSVRNMNACEEEEGRQEKRASEGKLPKPDKEDSNVSLSGEVESPVSNPVIPAFNMDNDTDAEGEEEGVMSAGVESAVPMILNTNQQADRPPDTVQFHMDSDTDNDEDENENVPSKAPEMFSSSHENPRVISVSVVTMDSDTDVDEDAAVSDAATKIKSTSFQSTGSADSASSVQLRKFHPNSDTDAEEEEEERGAKLQNSKKHETSSKLDIKLIGPNSTSAAPNSLHLNSDTDDEAAPAPSANKPSSAATVTASIAATDVGADLDILSDSDTDVEDNVPLVTPPAVQTLAGTTSKTSQSDSDADTDVDESSMPPAGVLANQVDKVDSDTDVDDEDVNMLVAGVDQISRLQGDRAPGILLPPLQLNCSTPLQLPDDVAEMDTQVFVSPMSGAFTSPSVRSAVLRSFPECLEDEDLAEAETQAFTSYTWECKNSVNKDTASEGEDQNDAPAGTEPLDFGIPLTIAMAETQLMSSVVEEEMVTATSDIGATQPMATCEDNGSHSEDSLPIPRKRKAKKLHLEDEETQELTNSDIFVAQTQPLAPSEEDDDDDTDSIIGPRKRKAKPLQIENETQSLPSSEVSAVETQPLRACEGEQSDEEDFNPGSRKRKAKHLEFEDEQTQPLTNSDVPTLETLPLLTTNDKGSENKDSFSGKRKEKRLHLTDVETQPLNNSDISTLETQPSNTETYPQAEEENVKQSENGEACTEVQRQTQESMREVQEQAECSKRRTRGQQKSLPSTEAKKGRASADEDKEEVDQANMAGRENISRLQNDEDGGLEMESTVNKSVTTEGEEENLENKSQTKIQETPQAENTERTRPEKGKKKKENDTLECEKVEGEEEESNGEFERLQREREEKHLESANLELEEMERKKLEHRATSGKEKKARGKTLKEVEVKKEEQKQAEPQTPARGRRGRRTVAARSTMHLVSTPDDVPARRTRSRSNSSNSVSSEVSASSVTNQESKGRGRGRGAKRTSVTPQTTVRSTRKTVAAAAAELDKNDVNPPGLISTSVVSNSLNAETSSCSVSSQNKGRGGKRRGKEIKTEPCSESGAPVVSQSPQLSAPTARGRKSRTTERSCSEVIHEDDQSKTESQQSSATRGRRQAGANGSQQSEKDHTDQEEESLLPKRNIRGRGQKIAKSETVEEALVPAVGDCKDAKSKSGKRRQGECSSNHTEKIPKTDAATEERKDIIQGKTSSAVSGTQAKPNAKTSPPDEKVMEKETCETKSVQRKARSRPSVAANKKKEESRESEASDSSMETDASELPETPSNRASRKRQATADSPLLAKSLRSSAASPVASGRRRASSQTYRVLFTGLEDEAGKRVLARLGGVMAKGVADMNCLVTDKVRRTVKFLCAVAKGIPVVTTEWLEKSGKSGSFLSTGAFLVKDADQEKKFNFSLEESLSAASSQPLFQGYEIHVTKSVLPEPVHMREIIACSGATFLPKMPSSQKPHTVVISCEDDWPLCGPAVSASLPIVTAEFILTGILQQKIDFQTHELSLPAPNPQAAGGRRKSKKKM